MYTGMEVISKIRVVENGYSGSMEPGKLEVGCYHRISHQSASTSTKMIFGLFLPSAYGGNEGNWLVLDTVCIYLECGF